MRWMLHSDKFEFKTCKIVLICWEYIFVGALASEAGLQCRITYLFSYGLGVQNYPRQATNFMLSCTVKNQQRNLNHLHWIQNLTFIHFSIHYSFKLYRDIKLQKNLYNVYQSNSFADIWLCVVLCKRWHESTQRKQDYI